MALALPVRWGQRSHAWVGAGVIGDLSGSKGHCTTCLQSHRLHALLLPRRARREAVLLLQLLLVEVQRRVVGLRRGIAGRLLGNGRGGGGAAGGGDAVE